MAYFSNGTEGEVFDDQCSKCKFGEGTCPIAFVQQHFNYDACNNQVATDILNCLVNNDGTCMMYRTFEKDFSIEEKESRGVKFIEPTDCVHYEVCRFSEDCGCYDGCDFRREKNLKSEKINDIVDTLKNANNECTSAPYWFIVDPKQNMRCDYHIAASQITGIFFSREDAERFLKDTRYNFGNRAVVYCHSGNYSKKYLDFYREITKR